jgi:N-acetyltransferase
MDTSHSAVRSAPADAAPQVWTPTTLVGTHVRLEPLAHRHAADLCSAIAPDTFTYFPPPYGPEVTSMTEPAMRTYIDSRNAAADSISYAIVLAGSGRAVGSTCFLDIRARHRGVEIGASFIAPDQRGTKVNPESKLLMLAHAFDTMHCERVQLKCDGRNTLSQRAITKLGALREGTLRKHMIMGDGFVRDTVMFSIIADEWPRVREGLMKRLTV